MSQKLDLEIFPKTSLEDWKAKASELTENEDPLEKLKWSSHGIHDLLPYYDHEFSIPTEQQDFFENIPHHRWKLYQQVHVSDEKTGNQEALAALMGGCDGILFRNTNQVNEEVLLKDIDSTICDLFFDDFTSNASITVLSSEHSLSLDETDSPINQIAQALKSTEKQKFLFRTSFPDFFMEIATIRAMRFLLKSKGLTPSIHTSIPAHESPDHQWFLNTTAGLAAILGGSHSIDLQPGLSDPRIARNVGNLIRDESKIDNYEDQCGGSYFVEVLTTKIIENVTALEHD